MTTQTTYKERMDPPRPGTIASSDYNTKTRLCETAAGIGFGLAVSRGANSDKGSVIGGAAFLGITVRDVTVRIAADDKYAQYNNMGVLTRGEIWVSPAVAVEEGDNVTYDTVTGRLSNTGGTAIPGAKWLDSAAGDGAARVELLANAGS